MTLHKHLEIVVHGELLFNRDVTDQSEAQQLVNDFTKDSCCEGPLRFCYSEYDASFNKLKEVEL